MSEYFTVKEFAIILGVHPSTVTRAIQYGRISAFRVGTGEKGSYRIPNNEHVRMAEFNLEDIINAEVEKRLKEKSTKEG